ncbi:MAG: hypothetical protein LJE91_00415 [Gammaproteobacteria bacterium]|nr:hypothetical protein [Gammaproteobacteria bacterium]
MIRLQRALAYVCSGLMLACHVHAADGVEFGYDARFMGDSNVGNATEGSDREASFRSLGALKLGYNRTVGELKDLHFWARGGGEYFTNIDDLSNIFIQGHADYTFATSTNFSAPVITLLAEVAGIDVRSDIRDSANFILGAEIESRLNPKFKLGSGVLGIYNDAKSDVFTTSDVQVFLDTKYNILEQGALYGVFTYMYGDVTSTGTPTLDIIKASNAVTPDDAFGGLAANQLAYRLLANTFILQLGYNHFFNERVSLDVSLRGIYSIATENSDLTYERYQAIAKLSGSF